jgi:hypothetical protein
MRLDSVIINSEFKTSIYVCSFIHSVIYKNENGIIVLVSLVISFSLCSAVYVSTLVDHSRISLAISLV